MMEGCRPFSLLVKPASADCNLHCTYCFYLETCDLYPEPERHRMSDDVLDRVIRTYMATGQSVYSFVWQGGEPLLMGLDFFRKVTDFQKKYGGPGVAVSNGVQTNATLIDDALAEHFARYRFLVGCSLDGPRDIHDTYRRSRSGRPSHARVLKGLDTLRRHHVDVNVLVLVSQANVTRGRDVYRYLKDQGLTYHQYVPCVEFDRVGRPQPFAVDGREWGDFLCEIFDLWYPRDIHTVSVRHFDSILQKMLDGSANVCTLGDNCCQYFVVEYNGDVYPCDFFVREDLRIGNIMNGSWEDMLDSPKYLGFGSSKASWHSECDRCDCLDFCMGDCLKHRMYGDHTPENLSWLCVGWQQFARHTREKFRALANQMCLEQQGGVLHGDRATRGNRPPQPKVGRNEPCPCGSGKKFKKCCGR